MNVLGQESTKCLKKCGVGVMACIWSTLVKSLMSMCWLWCHQYNKHALYFVQFIFMKLITNTLLASLLNTWCFVCVLSHKKGSPVPTMPQLPVMSMVPNVPEVPELQLQSKISLQFAPKIQINSINSAAAEHGIWVKITMFSGTSLSVKTLVLSLDCSSFSNKLLAEKSSVFMFLWAFLCGLDRTLLAMQQNLQWILCKRTLGSILAVISRMTRRFDTKRDDILL